MLEVNLEGKSLVKVGVTCRSKVEDRVTEILVGIWKKYRIFPQCYVKRYRKVDNVYRLEATLHKELKGFSYKTEFKFGGSTEFFDVDLDDVVTKYDRLVNEDKTRGK